MPPAWVNWFPTSSFKGAMPCFSAEVQFQVNWSTSKRPEGLILCRPWWLIGTLAHLFYSDCNPELLHWLLSLLLDFFFFKKGKICQLAISGYIFFCMLGQMALSVIKLYRTKRFHCALYLLCTASWTSIFLLMQTLFLSPETDIFSDEGHSQGLISLESSSRPCLIR